MSDQPMPGWDSAEGTLVDEDPANDSPDQPDSRGDSSHSDWPVGSLDHSDESDMQTPPWHQLPISEEAKRRLDFLHENGTLRQAREYMYSHHIRNLVLRDELLRTSADTAGPVDDPDRVRSITWTEEDSIPEHIPTYPFGFSFGSRPSRTCVFNMSRKEDTEERYSEKHISMLDKDMPNLTTWKQLLVRKGSRSADTLTTSTISYMILTPGEIILMTKSTVNDFQRAVLVKGRTVTELDWATLPTLQNPH